MVIPGITRVLSGCLQGYVGFGDVAPIVENHLEKNENMKWKLVLYGFLSMSHDKDIGM